MTDLAILVPVLGRPHRVEPLLASIEQATPDARVVFLTDPDDTAERRAIEQHTLRSPLTVLEAACGGNYASKINHGVRITTEPLLFTAADDLDFQAGWFETARALLSERVHVVGVNDRCSRRVRMGRHATHFLMTREYAEQPTIDGHPGPFCTQYDHNFCDDELVGTAQRRRVVRFARHAIVPHLHPDNGTAEWDDTYTRGREHFDRDRQLFRDRRALWA
jgi:hypothetical protein